MADNLTISIGADASKLRAELAVAQSEMRAMTRELNTLANTARRSGDDLSFAKVGQAAARFERVTAQVAELKAQMTAAARPAESLGQALNGAFSRAGAAIREPLDALAMMRSGLRQTAEVAGIVFAIDKIAEFTRRMGELGERTVYMAAATGQTPHQFSLLTTELRLAGGDAENASRTIERLGTNIQEALTTKSSTAAKATHSLGITQEELQRASRDTGYAIDLLARKWGEFANDLTKSADFRALLGRGFEALIPVLLKLAEAQDKVKAKAEATGLVLTNQEAQALADTGEKVHELALTLEGAGVRGFIKIKGAIDKAVDGLKSFITMAGNALAAVTNIDTAAEHAEAIRRAKGIGGRTTGPTVGPSGHWIFRAGKMRFTPYPEIPPVPGDNLNFVMPPEGLTGPGSGPGEWSEREEGKPKAAPWPTTEKRGRDTTNKDYQNFAEGERLKIAAAELAGQNIMGIYAEWLAEAKRVYTEDSIEYKRVQVEILRVRKQAIEELNRLGKQHLDSQLQQMREAAHEAAKTAKAWAEPFKQAFDKIGSGIETAITDALLRKGNKDWGRQLYQSLVGDVVSGAGSVLSRGVTAALPGAKEGENLSTYFARQLAELILHSSFLAGILGNTAATAAASTASAGTSGISAAGSAGGILGGLSNFASFLGLGSGGGAAAAGGFTGTIEEGTTALSALMAFARGGIVPSAAAGWALPSFPGMQPAMLHSREMVLPAQISEGLQNIIAQGGSGDTHLHLHSQVMDGPSIDHWFKGLVSRNPGAVSDLFRSNRLTPRTI